MKVVLQFYDRLLVVLMVLGPMGAFQNKMRLLLMMAVEQ